jgi:putative protease
MPELEVGVVTHYFDRPHVAIVKMTALEIKVGDQIHIKGAHTDIAETVTSMEVEHQKLEVAKPPVEVGLQVADRVRTGDKVFRVG